MITLNFAFWLLVVLFAVIGAIRGWAKELLVTFSVILSLFIIAVIQRFAPSAIRAFFLSNESSAFWFNSIVLLFLVFFGYQTPNLPRMPSERFAREKLSDTLLGFFLGAINGYLIIGSLWYFMAQAGYPFDPLITEPQPSPPIVNYLPPELLIANNSPFIYFAVAISFLFVLVVFI